MTIARLFRRIAKTHPLVSISVTFVAYVRTKTLCFPDIRRHLTFLPDLRLRFSLASLRVSLRRIRVSLAHGIPYLSFTFRRVSNALVPGVSEITTDRCYDD